jgi:hypothetical protein
VDKKLLFGVSICAVVLLIMASLTNVVGYQTVQTSQQNLIEERINQRELVFQTIVDIANNKEIQRIILKSQMSRGIFPTSEIPILTKNQLEQMYFIGLILLKVISKTKIHSIVQQYHLNNEDIGKEISAVIKKDATINTEITQLSTFMCDCENTSTTYWQFPVLCTLLAPIYVFSMILVRIYVALSYALNPNPNDNPFLLAVQELLFLIIFFTYVPMVLLGVTLWCWWVPEVNQ